MKNQFKKILLWLFLAMISITIIAATTVVVTPNPPTSTDRALARWVGTSGWQITNSVITVDDFGNVSGIGAISSTEIDIPVGYITNGIIYIQQSSPPTAAFIGGTIGSITNYCIKNVNGLLMKYWSDGTTLWSQEVGSH